MTVDYAHGSKPEESRSIIYACVRMCLAELLMFASQPLPVYRFRLNSRRCMYTRAHSRCHFSPHAKPPWSPTLSVYNNPSVCYNILSILTCRYNIRAITMTECNETPDRSLFAPVQNVFFSFFFVPDVPVLLPLSRSSVCVCACVPKTLEESGGE